MNKKNLIWIMGLMIILTSSMTNALYWEATGETNDISDYYNVLYAGGVTQSSEVYSGNYAFKANATLATENVRNDLNQTLESGFFSIDFLIKSGGSGTSEWRAITSSGNQPFGVGIQILSNTTLKYWDNSTLIGSNTNVNYDEWYSINGTFNKDPWEYNFSIYNTTGYVANYQNIEVRGYGSIPAYNSTSIYTDGNWVDKIYWDNQRIYNETNFSITTNTQNFNITLVSNETIEIESNQRRYETNISLDDTREWNITISSSGYEIKEFINYNISNNRSISTVLTGLKYNITFNALKIQTNISIVDFNFTLENGTKYNIYNRTYYEIEGGTQNIIFSKQGYFNKTHNVLVNENKTYNLTNNYDLILNLTFKLKPENTSLTGANFELEINGSKWNTNSTTANMLINWTTGNTTYTLSDTIYDYLPFPTTNISSWNITTKQTYNKTIYLEKDYLQLDFMSGGSPIEVYGVIYELNNYSGTANSTSFTNTSFIRVQDELQKGMISIKFNYNNISEHHQYYEYINYDLTNSYETEYAQLEVFNNTNELRDMFIKIRNRNNDAIQNAEIRLLKVPVDGTEKLISQRLSDENGLTYFVLEENASYVFKITKGSINYMTGIINGLDLITYDETDPLIITMDDTAGDVEGRYSCSLDYRDQYYTDTLLSRNLTVRVSQNGRKTVEIYTDYYSNSIGKVWPIYTEDLGADGIVTFNLISGTHLPTSGTNNITITISVDGTLYTYELPHITNYNGLRGEEKDMFNPSDDLIITILVIGMIIISFVMSIVFSDVWGYYGFLGIATIFTTFNSMFMLLVIPFVMEYILSILNKMGRDEQ